MLNDYAPYRVPVIRRADVDALTAAPEMADGIHVVGGDDGPPVHLMVQGSPFTRDMPVLPVFFSAAVVGRRDKSGPFFSGRSVTQRLGLPWLALSDPTIDLAGGIDLGWYTGAAGSATQARILEVLADIHRRAGAELLLIGGSGGGFAALHLGTRLAERASAFVWNPQTSITRYVPASVSRYLEAVAGEPATGLFASGDEAAVAQILLDGGIEHDLTTADPRAPRRLFYLQNASDWHLKAHARPYILGQGYVHRGRGYYTNPAGHSLVVSSFGDGHAMPADPLVDGAIRLLLDPACTSRNVFNALVDQSLLDQSVARTMPRDMTAETELLVGQLGLEVHVEPDATRAVLTTGTVRPGEGGLAVRFGFSGPDRQHLGSTSDGTLHTVVRPGAETVTASVEDGFGNLITTLEARVPARPQGSQGSQGSPEPPAQRSGPRVFVYGSCVSRDAFELEHRFSLAGYVARSCMGSAFSRPVPELADMDLSPNPSAFQRRVVATDLHKTLADALSTVDFDILLVDLIDERLALIDRDGGRATYSPELARCGFTPGPGRENLVESGTSEHLDAFVEGWDHLVQTVSPDRIVVSRVYWASASGDTSTGSTVAETAAANAYLRRLYDHVATTPGVRFIDYDASLLVTDPTHRWGPSPFHYRDDLYRHTLASLERLAARRPEPGADASPSPSPSPSPSLPPSSSLPMRIVSETLFCDHERDPEVVATFAGRYLHTLRTVASMRVPDGVELVAVTYVSADKATQRRMFEDLVSSFPPEVRGRFLVVGYEHPPEGYPEHGGRHADLEKNPNKHAPLRDRLFRKAWDEMGAGTPEHLVRIGLDDDDLWHPGHIEEVVRIATAALVHTPDRVVGVGLQTCELAYVSPDGVELQEVRISRALTGNKFYVGPAALLPRLMTASPWSLPERFDVNTAERFSRAGVELLLTGDNAATWTYVRWGDNLSVQRKDPYYEEVLSERRLPSVEDLVEDVVHRTATSPRTEQPTFFLQPRSLEVWARRKDSGSITVHTNADDFDGEGLRLQYSAIHDGAPVLRFATSVLDEMELDPSPPVPVQVRAVLFKDDSALGVGSTRGLV